MPRRSSIPDGPNELAKAIVDEATQEKNPAAGELGRLGGLKGGKARAKKLTKKRRSEIARRAAQARWNQERRGFRNLQGSRASDRESSQPRFL